MSEQRSGLQAIVQEPSNKPIIQRFVRTAISAAVLPLIAYFATLALTKSLDLQKTPLLSPPILSGLVAVLTLNIITISFALQAVHERPNLNPTSTHTEGEITTQPEASSIADPPTDSTAHQKEE